MPLSLGKKLCAKPVEASGKLVCAGWKPGGLPGVVEFVWASKDTPPFCRSLPLPPAPLLARTIVPTNSALLLGQLALTPQLADVSTTMATSMLCDDPLFGTDSLFGGMSLDLEDLFSDDLMGALLGEHGASELLVAPPSCMAPAVVEQPCSSGSGSGTALAARSPSPSRSITSGQSQGAPVLQLALQRSAGPPTRTRRPQGAWARWWGCMVARHAAAICAHPRSTCHRMRRHG